MAHSVLQDGRGTPTIRSSGRAPISQCDSSRPPRVNGTCGASSYPRSHAANVICRARWLVLALVLPLAILVILTGCQDGGAPAPSISGLTASATPSLAAPSPSRAPVSSPVAAAEQTLLDVRLPGQPPGWPDDPLGQAQFTPAGYLIQPRNPGQFVAIRAPV